MADQTLRDARSRLAAALRALHERRVEDPLAGLPVVASVVLVELPDSGHTRPPSLVDRYQGRPGTYHHAMERLAASGLRHLRRTAVTRG
ncbi:hypothetical protein BJF83_17490 [Nocardiopsis sp. CNR-923]|uniref:hypothetical protein n=1 Tax=Nocardiopsis sp. CNR-923 TaxID=1904965 RepID=UPI000965F56D|nr:hypothetical protein [Nocardiopsis sp. CNR-923]OLT27777.1 hypothetical protein BJF83_17490 [Nocardiopsis sp. CNR-923]